LLGVRAAPFLVPTLKYDRGKPGTLQVGGQTEAVVPGSDHDCVVRARHPSPPPAAASDLAAYCPPLEPRCRGAPNSAVAGSGVFSTLTRRASAASTGASTSADSAASTGSAAGRCGRHGARLSAPAPARPIGQPLASATASTCGGTASAWPSRGCTDAVRSAPCPGCH